MIPFDPLKRPKTINPLLPTTGSAGPRPGDNVSPLAAPTGYGAGAATRDAVGAGVAVLANASRVKTGLAGIAKNAVAAPIEGFTRGLLGAAPTPPVAAPAIARPQFGNVVGTADTVSAPARNPAGNPQPSVAGNVGGVPAPPKPGEINTFTGTNGVTRAVPGMDAKPAGVPAQSFGGLSMPAAAPVHAQPNLSVNLPRPASVGSPYALHEARDANAAMLSKLDSQTFANSLAVNRGSRGAIALQGQINDQMAGLHNAGLESASAIAGGDRDAVNAIGIAGLEQHGENQRTALKDIGDTNRTGMEQAGANARTRLATLAELSKPQTLTDADGNLLQVVGTKATSVTDAIGRPVQSKIDRPDANTILSAYTEQQKALDEAAALTGKPADYSELKASPLGQAYQQVLRGPPPAEHIAALRANPHWADSFNQHYGNGAAARYLAGGSE